MKYLIAILGVLVVTVFIGHFLLSNARVCGEWEIKVNNAIDEANFCTSDAECRAFSFGCPFGCEALLNRESADTVRAKVSAYHSKCLMLCPEDCEMPQRHLACVAGRCVRR